MTEENLNDKTRRAILKGAAATLGVAATGGVASGHPGSGDHGNEGHEHHGTDEFQMSTVGYHSLGGIGSESISGDSDEPHYGGISELRVNGDIAAVGILSSNTPTIDRGIAILDVSAYTRAESRAELESAEMSVLSFVQNENNLTSVMDVKFSDDGQYLFGTKQPVAVLFQALAGKAPEPRTKDDRKVSSASHAGIFAVDISDPGNPEILDEETLAFGIHNCYHHRIGGEDYVFGVKGPTGDPAGIYVFQFDRTTGELQQVNFWADGSDVAQGEVSSNMPYAHDISVIDDPVTGDPYAYLANWSAGARVLDVSNPRNIEELGQFKMERAHTIAPLHRTVNGKRLFVVGQENPGPDGDTKDDNSGREDLPDGHTGHFYLVDASKVHEANFDGNLGTASQDGKGPSSSTNELAKWVWRLDAEFDNYTYSAHNIDVIDTEVNGTRRLFVTVGHYHAGTRVLEIGYPGHRVSEETGSNPHGGAISTGGNAYGRNNWKLAETGWSRTHQNVPEDAKFGSLSSATPYHWGTVSENGVLFASCISTGVYAMSLDDPAIPVGTRVVHEAEATRDGTGSAFTAGQTEWMKITVETEEGVLVRDRIPNEWEIVDGVPDSDIQDVSDGQNVVLGEVGAGDSTTLEYFAEAPEGTSPGNSASYTFGPIEVSTDGGETWEALAATETAKIVVGLSTSL